MAYGAFFVPSPGCIGEGGIETFRLGDAKYAFTGYYINILYTLSQMFKNVKVPKIFGSFKINAYLCISF